MEVNRLLITSKPYFDESLVGFLSRLALLNNYSISWLYGGLGVDVLNMRNDYQLGKAVIDQTKLAK
ncbi:hypothetical protein HZF08_16030 [Paenibacillus sp. CGMCC 1.16610]|uniref:Uncharacterized protein n=1 Tax=Paenibacillus anseongense TaxID=2682845 RepID=A0ABW9UHY0_9BACL|nr:MULTISPECIES: hypothetical protein [Paenibacillus]MBA2939823.1 hypothetical protein [Paenibacillus sp. CGMCC 1.16610]MVQ39483.1 hypothetical protein [Paenibacillus anseongense]